MLKHTESDTEAISAAKVRVTPEELAAAITRLEARKDAGHRDLEGTVAIGEVVQQLGLDATPEEVLAEIQVGRTEQSTKQKGRLSLKIRRLRLSLVVFGTVTALSLSSLWRISHFSDRVSTDVVTAPTASAVPIISHNPQSFQIDPNLLVADVSGKVVMLSEVGDNQPVHCYFDNGSFLPFVPGIPPNALWTLIKYNDTVYVRGWTLKMSPKVLQEKGALISAQKVNEFGLVVPITLPLNGFSLSYEGSNTYFYARNIHLDSHAWEKWKP